MKILKGFILILLLHLQVVCEGATKEVSLYSNCLNREVKSLIILPDYYDNSIEIPVVYLLHGHGVGYLNWYKKVPELSEFANTYNILIICPSGGRSSWYIDSPIDPSMQFESYFIQELIPFIDFNYSTIKNRAFRAISGNSMGGFGAFYLGFRNADIFGQIGSTSGAFEIIPFRNKWNLQARFGEYATNKEFWKKSTIKNILPLIKKQSIHIYFDCGVKDVFIHVNRRLHDLLEKEKIDHTFYEGEGGHNWQFWKESIKKQLQFFNARFQENR